MATTVDAESLMLLLKAPNKDFVRDVFVQCFRWRLNKALPQALRSLWAETLDASVSAVDSLVASVNALISAALYSKERLRRAFPEDFHPQLKTLIANVLVERIPEWSQEVLRHKVSLPRLREVDWRVDVKTSSNKISRMAVPSVLLQMKVEDPATSDDEVASDRNIDVELTRETLQTLLDGLGRLRDQLSGVSS